MKKKKDVKLTHAFYNDLLDSRQQGAAKIVSQLVEQGIELPQILRYLMNNGVGYYESMRIIKEITA